MKSDSRATSLLTAKKVSKHFAGTQVLHDVNLSISVGEILAIMGPSGSGKSTLLHCLSGVLKPSSGEVSYRAQRLHCMSDDERSALRCREFGFVFQTGQLIVELNVIENVAIPLLLRGQHRRRARRAAQEWLDRLGILNLSDRRIGELSGGEAQRVAIARALVGAPTIVFADEPTGSLDTANGEVVLTLLTGIARTEQASVVLVTHDAFVAGFADRVVKVRDGRVAAADAQPSRGAPLA